MQIKEAANERSRWFIDSLRCPGAVCVGDFSNTQQTDYVPSLCDAGPSVYISHKPLLITWDGNLFDWLDH